MLNGLITESQWAAGEKFLRERLRYRAVLMSPDSLRRVSPAIHSGDTDEDVVAAFESALHSLGHLAVDVEWVLCMDGGLSDLAAYRQGLDVLRRHYRL